MLRIATSSSLTGMILLQALISVFSGAVFLFSKITRVFSSCPNFLHKLARESRSHRWFNQLCHEQGVDCRAGVLGQCFSGVHSVPGAVQGSWNEHSTLVWKDVAVVMC